MRIRSLEHYGIDGKKLALVALAVGIFSASTIGFLTGGIVGSGAVALELMMGIASFYIVLSLPKRMLNATAMAQSKEATSLAVMASTNFEATGSRSKALLFLRSGVPEVSRFLRSSRRKILLGYTVEEATAEAGRLLSSYSLTNVIRGSSAPMGAIEEGGEEVQGRIQSSALEEETRLPIFVTVCFFSPIMLLLYAAFSHVSMPSEMAELVVLQAAILEVSHQLSASGNWSPV